jgi:hypothetical protein
MFFNNSHGDNLIRGEILEKGRTYFIVDFSKEAKRLGIIEIEKHENYNIKDLHHIRVSNTKCEETSGH